MDQGDVCALCSMRAPRARFSGSTGALCESLSPATGLSGASGRAGKRCILVGVLEFLAGNAKSPWVDPPPSMCLSNGVRGGTGMSTAEAKKTLPLGSYVPRLSWLRDDDESFCETRMRGSCTVRTRRVTATAALPVRSDRCRHKCETDQKKGCMFCFHNLISARFTVGSTHAPHAHY